MKKTFKFGFTLAEVLITLGIIGVISAMTIPTVLTNHQTKVRITQMQKLYNDVSNAAVAALADERVDTLDYTYAYEDIDGAISFLKKYLKVSDECTPAECFGASYSSLDGSESVAIDAMFSDDTRCLKLSYGFPVCVSDVDADDGYIYHGYIRLVFDLNGKAGPNTNGRDLFTFEIFSDGTVGNSYNVGNEDWSCEDWADQAGYRGACFDKIMLDGWKMDY